MRKHIVLITLNILIVLNILGLIGCSSFGAVNVQAPALTPTSPPTYVVTTTPTFAIFTGKIAFVSYDNMDNHHINVMNANGSGLVNITPPNPPRNIEFLSWSPDGEYIAFSAWKDGKGQIFKIKPDGSGLTQLTFGDVGGMMPSWSPDGESIMFASSDQDILDNSGSPAMQIYIMNSDGSGIYRFVVKPKLDNTTMTGSYRKDGLIAVEEPITRYAVTNYIVNSDGVIQKQFPEFSTDIPIDWSPDGKFVAYSPGRSTPGCFGIVVMRFDQSEKKCLMDQKINSQIYFVQTSWSPDGKYIMFLSNLNGDYDLYAIRPDGLELTQLTNMPGHEDWAVWWSAP
jgi:Tol biopolymer transport system component